MKLAMRKFSLAVSPRPLETVFKITYLTLTHANNRDLITFSYFTTPILARNPMENGSRTASTWAI
jgi:hypothetical protein